MNLKEIIIEDRRYLDYLQTCHCLFTGERGRCEPVHIGTKGTGKKISDSMAIPLDYRFHRNGHQHGEVSMLREHVPNDVLRDALRLYGHFQLYLPWVEEGRPKIYIPIRER